jgi:DNA-binding LytR/AlgR family response regulator
MNCLAIDDEPLALTVIENYVGKIPGLNLIDKITSPVQALEILKNNTIDLLFLDIQMSEISGIDFLKSLSQPPMVIFTTAYEEYALESYELDVVDYLLKPFSFERFLKAANKAFELYNYKAEKTPEENDRTFIFVRSDYQMVKINFDDILYIEGLKDYVKVFTGPRPIFSHQNLKSIEGKLPESKFIRVHKSYIISITKIESIQKNSIKLPGIEIPIGETYRENVHKVLGGY